MNKIIQLTKKILDAHFGFILFWFYVVVTYAWKFYYSIKAIQIYKQKGEKFIITCQFLFLISFMSSFYSSSIFGFQKFGLRFMFICLAFWKRWKLKLRILMWYCSYKYQNFLRKFWNSYFMSFLNLEKLFDVSNNSKMWF